MANFRRTPSGPQKPQLDYYEYKRQREERLREIAAAQGRTWEPPVLPQKEQPDPQPASEPAQEAPQQEYEPLPEEDASQPQESALQGALGKLGSWTSRFGGALSRVRGKQTEEDAYEEYDDAAQPQEAVEYAEEEPFAGEESFAEEPSAEDPVAEPDETAEEPAFVPEDFTEETDFAQDALEADPADVQEDAEDLPEQVDADAYQPEYEQDEYPAEEYEEYEEEADPNASDSPFAALARVAKTAGGFASGLLGSLKERFGKKDLSGEEYPEEEYEAEEYEADGEYTEETFDDGSVFAVENAEEDLAFEPEEYIPAEEPSEAEDLLPADAEDLLPAQDAAEFDLPADAEAPLAEDELSADLPIEEPAGEEPAQDLFMEDEWAEEEVELKPGLSAKLKGLLAALKIGRRRKAEEETDFAAQDDVQHPFTFTAAADMPAAEEESIMNEQENMQPKLSEQLAKELDSAPVLSRRERKALAAKLAAEQEAAAPEAAVETEPAAEETVAEPVQEIAVEAAPAEEPAPAAEHEPEVAPSLEGVDEPTREFVPVNVRELEPIAEEPDEDDEEDDEETKKPARRGLFGFRRKPVEEDDEDDMEDDEDEYDDEDEEDDEEILPRRGRRSRYEDEEDDEDEEYDDEDEDWDEEDDEDFDDYDDDEEDESRSGFGWGLLRFLRGLLVLLIIGALLVLGLRELEKREIISLDAVRSIELGGVTDTLFPEPAADSSLTAE